MKFKHFLSIIGAGLTAIPLLAAQTAAAPARGQTANYTQAVARAQADLKTGKAAQALAESQKAITINPRGWQAYVVAGGALQVEQQYDKAIEDFTQALKLAPESKQAAVKGLLEKCIKAQIAAQSTPAPATPASVSSTTQPISQLVKNSDGPSYADTVKWIQDNIRSAGVPVPSPRTQTGETFVCTARKSDGTCADGYNDSNGYKVTSSSTGDHYAFEADGCSSLTVIDSEQSMTASSDAGTGSQSDVDKTVQRWKLPIASIDHVMLSPEKVKLPDLADESHPIGSPAPPPFDPGFGWGVYIVMKDKSGTETITDSDLGNSSGQISNHNCGGMPNTNLPGVCIFFGMPGTEDVAPHFVNAFQHLVEICKEHPEQAPKSLF